MLSRSTQKKLVLYLTAMLFLHMFLAWNAWRGIRIGMPDFSIFYTAGEILHSGRGYELYDDTVQEAVQRSFAPMSLQKRGSFIPFNHPPFEALVFLPFARLPYLGAYFVWLAINLGLTFTMLVFLRGNFTALGNAPFYLWMLAAFAFFPLFFALLQGQDSVFVLFCYAMAFVAFRQGTESREGAWAGLGLCKFHLVLPFVFPLLLLRTQEISGRISAGSCHSRAFRIGRGWLERLVELSGLRFRRGEKPDSCVEDRDRPRSECTRHR